MTLPATKLGLGIGWRPELALLIERFAGLGFVEVIAEEFAELGQMPPPLAALKSRGVAIVPHGISLSLGSAEPPDDRRLATLARTARRLDAPLVSEHLAYVRAEGLESGHLLPVPRTRQALGIVVENIRRATAALPVPLAIENIAALVEWPDNEMDEATFLAEVFEQTDALLLLDVSNLYANARNHGWDPLRLLNRAPLGRIAYAHIAGGVERDGVYHDSHAHPVPPQVIELLEEVCARVELPGILLEQDDQFPPDEQLLGELTAIAAAVARGAARREAIHVD